MSARELVTLCALLLPQAASYAAPRDDPPVGPRSKPEADRDFLKPGTKVYIRVPTPGARAICTRNLADYEALLAAMKRHPWGFLADDVQDFSVFFLPAGRDGIMLGECKDRKFALPVPVARVEVKGKAKGSEIMYVPLQYLDPFAESSRREFKLPLFYVRPLDYTPGVGQVIRTFNQQKALVPAGVDLDTYRRFLAAGDATLDNENPWIKQKKILLIEEFIDAKVIQVVGRRSRSRKLRMVECKLLEGGDKGKVVWIETAHTLPLGDDDRGAGQSAMGKIEVKWPKGTGRVR